jgi:hypothetical protein
MSKTIFKNTLVILKLWQLQLIIASGDSLVLEYFICVSKPGLTTSTALSVSSNFFKSAERAVASCFKPHLMAGIDELFLFLYIMMSHKSDMLG